MGLHGAVASPSGARYPRFMSETPSETTEAVGAEQAVVLDARGLNCPMPLLKAKKALNELPAAGLLRVIATDPGSVRDFEVFSRQSGHQLLESTEHAGTYRYLLRKKAL
jgi:tRNA 2-thiouridine synthesizing protein A